MTVIKAKRGAYRRSHDIPLWEKFYYGAAGAFLAYIISITLLWRLL